MRRSELVLVCLAALLIANWFTQQNGGGSDAPEGFTCLILRQTGDTLTPGEAAIVGSQMVEDEATSGGGTYRVYWSDAPGEVLPEHRAAYEKLQELQLPSWYLADGGTGIVVAEPLPQSFDEAIAKIRKVRGAR